MEKTIGIQYGQNEMPSKHNVNVKAILKKATLKDPTIKKDIFVPMNRDVQ